MKIALLVVDMQNVFVQEMVEQDVGKACEHINYVAGVLRAKDHAVVHIQDMEGAEEEAQASGIIPEIRVEETDIRVTKHDNNAFWKTDLEEMLRSRGVGFVVVAGFAAEHCVTFTFNGARERRFRAAILQNGIVGSSPEGTASVYRDRPLVSYPVIEYMAD